MNQTYDLVIVGGGSAGLTAAGFAVQLGARVALVEKHRIGGDCTWTGCVPSKTLLRSARVAHEMRTASRFGLRSTEPAIDFKTVMAHVRDVISEVYEDESPDSLKADGIDVFSPPARFLDPHTLASGESRLTARRVLIATGAGPFLPTVEGLEAAKPLTYETVWDLEVLPQRLIIIGAGPIGCEMAQAFQRLGSKVTLLEATDRVLPNDDEEASGVIAARFTEEGIDLRLNSELEKVWRDGDGVHLVSSGDEFVGDEILVAVGRRPNVDSLDLDRAGVIYNDTGIQVDQHLRTSQHHIYAAGDCAGGYQFTHYAGWQGFMAVRNALLPGTKKAVAERVPWTTFTDPEVAHVGHTEAQAEEKFGTTAMNCYWPMDQVDRARSESDTEGFLKIVHKTDGSILGVTIVAARAGEMIHEWALAIDHGLKVGDVANSIHVYPTYSTASMQAAAHIRVGQLLGGRSGRVIRGLSRLIR